MDFRDKKSRNEAFKVYQVRARRWLKTRSRLRTDDRNEFRYLVVPNYWNRILDSQGGVIVLVL